MCGVVINGLVGCDEGGGGGKGLTAAGVAGEAGVGAAGDEEAELVAAREVVGGGPEIDPTGTKGR